MRGIKRAPEGLVLKFHQGERELLAHLVGLLIDLVSELLPPDGEESQLIFGSRITREDLANRDPALARLFPSAYTDEEDDLEFRSFAEPDAALVRIETAQRVYEVLDGGGQVVVTPSNLGDWVKTLTAIRLVLSERDDPDLDDLGDWLGWLLESLLTA